jgi:hypothetical protein
VLKYLWAPGTQILPFLLLINLKNFKIQTSNMTCQKSNRKRNKKCIIAKTIGSVDEEFGSFQEGITFTSQAPLETCAGVNAYVWKNWSQKSQFQV